MIGLTLILILLGGGLAWYFSWSRATWLRQQQGTHSLPTAYGALAAAWAVIPALLFALLFWAFQETIISRLVMAALPASLTEGKTADALNLILTEIRSLAAGTVFGDPAPELKMAAARMNALHETTNWLLLVVVAGMMALGALMVRARITPSMRARDHFERVLNGVMITCALVAVLTTAGILASLVFEAGHFFAKVPISEFLFGLKWEPQIAIRADQVAGAGAFGMIPVMTGTLLITFIAMAFATPVGLFAAIYLNEFSSRNTRQIIKPILEILAGVPTIVYGFFAVLTVAPAMRSFGEMIGLSVSANSALAAGLVMGVMLIPFISSFADDALAAVPRSLRDGSLALGATQGETMLKVLIPAALPGIVGGVLLAVSRAIGETMIVVMAAGLIATLTLNPLDSVTTVTVQIVTLLIGDSEFDNPKTLAAFALGLLLFLVTLVLNIIALGVVRKYREMYD